MNKEEFSDKFKAGGIKVFQWGDTHRKAALAIACFVAGFFVGKL